MKYSFIEGETKVVDGKELHRIWHIQNQEKGGFVENENILSQQGSCWLHADSIAFGCCRIVDDAQVYGEVSGDAQISGHAKVMGRAFEHAKVTDDAEVYGQIFGTAIICDSAKVYGNVGGDTRVSGSDIVYGNLP